MRSSSDISSSINSTEGRGPAPADIPGLPSRGTAPGGQNQYSMIGKSIQIKGEILSSDPVYIYGHVEGSITAEGHRVTIGKEGRVKAGISAREVVIMGDVCGNVDGEYRVEIRGEGSLLGDLATHRLFIEDGAVLKGAIDVSKPIEEQKADVEAEPQNSVELGEVTSAA